MTPNTTASRRTLDAPTVIGLTGPAGSGKDTVADLLRTHTRFEKQAFAYQLRHEVCEAFGIDPLLLTHRATKEQPHNALALHRCKDHGFIGTLLRLDILAKEDGTHAEILSRARSPRQIMQWWGTEHRRNQNPNYWTRPVVASINAQTRYGNFRHVITDVRFENEAQAVRNMGGVIWQIKRPGLNVDTSHTSEVDGSQFNPDAIINNSYDIRHLQSVVMGAWVMLETGMSAQEVFNMGMAHTDKACEQWGVYNKALEVQAA